jgi:hypothetical protein
MQAKREGGDMASEIIPLRFYGVDCDARAVVQANDWAASEPALKSWRITEVRGSYDAPHPFVTVDVLVERYDAGSAGRKHALANEVHNLADEFERMARGGYGCSQVGVALHRAIDSLTSAVYGQDFAYCGREHSVS